MYNNTKNNLKPRKLIPKAKICENIISLKCLKDFLLLYRST